MKQERVEAFLLPDLNVEIRALIALAEKHRLPTLYSLSHVVTDWGGLAAYATQANGEPADIVGYADRILKGAKPGDLPVQEPARFELILNARARARVSFRRACPRGRCSMRQRADRLGLALR